MVLKENGLQRHREARGRFLGGCLGGSGTDAVRTTSIMRNIHIYGGKLMRYIDLDWVAAGLFIVSMILYSIAVLGNISDLAYCICALLGTASFWLAGYLIVNEP